METSFSFKTITTAILFFALSTLSSNAQKINGVICDENKKPLANVEIINLKNNFVTISKTNGSFSIKGNYKDLLKFIYPGKTSKTVAINNSNDTKVFFDDKAKIEKIAQEKRAKEQRKIDKKNKSKNSKIKTVAVKEHDLNGNPLKNNVVGQVFDNFGPIPGVNVVIRGTTKGTQTNFDGYYGIDAKMGDVLEISFIGMKTIHVLVNHKIINVKLQDDSVTLSEVVVTGYGSRTKKSKVSASYDVVKTEEISETVLPITDKSIVLKGNTSTKAGQLTAGEVNDFSHYDYWKGLTETEWNQWKNHWKINPKFRYSISLKNDKGFPIINRTVHLKNASEIIWTAMTDNTGRAELWYNPNDLSIEKVTAKLQIIDDKKVVLVANPKEFHEGINFYTYQENCVTQNKINIAFMIDATGSMGDEISYLQAELYDVIERTQKQFPNADLSMGSVFYRDNGDDYLVKNFDFTTEVPDVISFIKKQYADGGGDYPEAVIEGLEASIESMTWEDDARAKLLFLLLDAPPHYSKSNILKLQDLAKKAAQKGIRIIPIAASGIDKSTEYLMRSFALETNGTYLFITNHSGIGNNHIEPSTESYKVEMLNDLILRIILQFASVNNCESVTSNYSTNTKIEDQLTNAKTINFNYYPNPTTGPVTITIDKEATELYLFDTTGKLILYQTKKSTEYKIDLSQLPNAIYYLKVIVEDKELLGKIVKRN
ncbi:carboxypeptidase-like regulatory domain-containing protein [Flavobacterium sp.]|uniref:carboxypeptidase-like regulatory domain-containing protein n=1 Tax=Flavobacterium sp. TaxID=239 RepID=UPI00391CEB2F